MAENNENLHLNVESLESEKSEADEHEHEASSVQPDEKKAKLIESEGNKSHKASKNKPFSRASKIRQSIGSIGLSKKRKKKRLNENDDISETDSDKDSLRASKESVDMAPGVVKTKGLLSTGFVQKVTSQSDVSELPRKTFEWLISPVTTEKFFRYFKGCCKRVYMRGNTLCYKPQNRL
jgi:hypothetical protein